METALTFNNVNFSPVTRENKIWIRATELARALGYSREDKITRLYHNNADEFTPEMTQIVTSSDNPVSGLSVKFRIFSLRGCHLLAMLARTPVAKAFRKWILDVLDRLAREEKTIAANAPLTPEQEGALQAIIDARVTRATEAGAPLKRVLYAQAWNRFRFHFGLTKAQTLPQHRLNEAVAFLAALEFGPKKARAEDKATAANEPERSERPERLPVPDSDKLRKQIVGDLDRIERELGKIHNLVKWQLSPGAFDPKGGPEQAENFHAYLNLYNIALGGIFAARQAVAMGARIERK